MFTKYFQYFYKMQGSPFSDLDSFHEDLYPGTFSVISTFLRKRISGKTQRNTDDVICDDFSGNGSSGRSSVESLIYDKTSENHMKHRASGKCAVPEAESQKQESSAKPQTQSQKRCSAKPRRHLQKCDKLASCNRGKDKRFSAEYDIPAKTSKPFLPLPAKVKVTENNIPLYQRKSVEYENVPSQYGDDEIESLNKESEYSVPRLTYNSITNNNNNNEESSGNRNIPLPYQFVLEPIEHFLKHKQLMRSSVFEELTKNVNERKLKQNARNIPNPKQKITATRSVFLHSIKARDNEILTNEPRTMRIEDMLSSDIVCKKFVNKSNSVYSGQNFDDLQKSQRNDFINCSKPVTENLEWFENVSRLRSQDISYGNMYEPGNRSLSKSLRNSLFLNDLSSKMQPQVCERNSVIFTSNSVTKPISVVSINSSPMYHNPSTHNLRCMRVCPPTIHEKNDSSLVSTYTII